ncbi:hypothetical protein TRVL_08590 [Trypanosoma vivax]|nr:hypothetical protein TRVL_08590 [Trypanosoma vivax]
MSLLHGRTRMLLPTKRVSLEPQRRAAGYEDSIGGIATSSASATAAEKDNMHRRGSPPHWASWRQMYVDLWKGSGSFDEAGLVQLVIFKFTDSRSNLNVCLTTGVGAG